MAGIAPSRAHVPPGDHLGTRVDVDAATHLWRRLGFHPRDADIDAVLGRRRDEAIAVVVQQLQVPPAWPPLPAAATDLLAFGAPDLRDRAQATAIITETSGTDPEQLRPLGRAVVERLGQRHLALKAWWLETLVTTTNPVADRATLLWHGHFTSSIKKVRDPRLLSQQLVTIRRHVGGSYADLLHAVVDDPAMLVYLDATDSGKGAPNENLGRELLELFTLGEGHYTEEDVRTVARTLTGRSVRRRDGAVVSRPWQKDYGEKVLFGETVRSPRQVVDVLLTQPQTATTAAWRVARTYIDADLHVDDPIVQDAAKALRDRWSLADLTASLLAQERFWNEPLAQVRSPIVLVTSAAQIGRPVLASASGDARELVRAEALVVAAKRMGEDPLDPPNVKGWPMGTGWITSGTIGPRDRFLRALQHAIDSTSIDDDGVVDDEAPDLLAPSFQCC